MATGLAVVTSLMPVRWLSWTSGLATVVRVPVQPLAQAGVQVSHWLRPAADVVGESEALRELTDQLETTRALLHGARLQIDSLLEEIAVMQGVRSLRPGVEITPIVARVTGRSADRAGGPVRINAGSRHGVVAEAIVVYRGGHLFGRVAQEVSRLSSAVIPITDGSIGLLEGVVRAVDAPVGDVSGPHIQFAAAGDGRLVGDLDRAVVINLGDTVLLADFSWPDSAQGLVIGNVTSVEPKDVNPLLNTVTVEPRYRARQVASVTVIIERFTEPAGAGP
jgi:cell shape-determining protein MreC